MQRRGRRVEGSILVRVSTSAGLGFCSSPSSASDSDSDSASDSDSDSDSDDISTVSSSLAGAAFCVVPSSEVAEATGTDFLAGGTTAEDLVSTSGMGEGVLVANLGLARGVALLCLKRPTRGGGIGEWDCFATGTISEQ